MTTWQKSLFLWTVGGMLGGALSSASGKSTIGGVVLGALFVGAIGDKFLERQEEDTTRRLMLAAGQLS